MTIAPSTKSQPSAKLFVQGKNLVEKIEDISLDDMEFAKDNPRISQHGKNLSQKEIGDILFEQEDGLDALFGLVREALPERLYETAYALACDVAAADGALDEAELRLLEEIRYELNIDRLHAAAIERGARARHTV